MPVADDLTPRAALSRRGMLTGTALFGVLLAIAGDPQRASAANEPVWGFPLRNPVPISSGFRKPARPNHDGIDFWNNHNGSRRGDPIHAIADGVVLAPYWGDRYGNLVRIDHGDGWLSQYAHTATGAIVAPGSSVLRGRHIANIGDTGAWGSPHLHLEIKNGTTFLDPEPRVVGAPLPGTPPPPPPPPAETLETDVRVLVSNVEAPLWAVVFSNGSHEVLTSSAQVRTHVKIAFAERGWLWPGDNHPDHEKVIARVSGEEWAATDMGTTVWR